MGKQSGLEQLHVFPIVDFSISSVKFFYSITTEIINQKGWNVNGFNKINAPHFHRGA
jgi:hypothetical protein